MYTMVGWFALVGPGVAVLALGAGVILLFRATPATSSSFSWIVFSVLLGFSEPTLGEPWRDVRDLPLVVEGLVWLGLFPFVLAPGVWDSSWETWLRLLLVGSFAVGWSLAFWPRRAAQTQSSSRPSARA
jgi:hypothetical protein